MTKRLSHGLEALYAFTWAKELQVGTELGTVNDVFNRGQNKSISGFSRPLVSAISINYRLPAWGSNRIRSQVVRDWALGSTLSYASGQPILAPTSTNNLSTLLFRSTYFNRVPVVDPFLKDLNCHCIDPTQDLVLNSAAWTNPAAGQFRRPALIAVIVVVRVGRTPSLSLGRVFAFKEQMRLTVRINFINILNRLEMSNPAATSPTAATTKQHCDRIPHRRVRFC